MKITILRLTPLLAILTAAFSSLAVAAPTYRMNVPVVSLTVQSTAATPSPAALFVSASSLNFGGQNLTTASAAQSVLVTNTSTGSATLDMPTTTGPFTATTGCASTLAAGGNCTVSVTFMPSVEGPASGVLSIGSGGQAKTVALSGHGQGTKILSFSGITGNATTLSSAVNTSTSQAITVQNTGTGTVTLSADASLVAGSSAAFGLASSTCTSGFKLAPSATCSVTVNFAPTATATVSGAMRIASDATAGHLDLFLQGAGAQDPYYANVALLTHLDGVEGGTAFPSQIGPNLTGGGSPSVAFTSTASPKFGTSSARLPSGSWLTSAMTSGINVGAHADWTIEYYFKADSLTSGVMMSGFLDNFNRWTIEPAGSQTISVLSNNNIATRYTTSQVMATGAWYHLVVERQNGNVRVFVDGKEAAPTGNTAFNLSNVGGGTFNLGRMGTNAYFFAGNIDDVRITADVARYSGTFTPPAQAFPNQ